MSLQENILVNRCRGTPKGKFPILIFCTGCSRKRVVLPSCNQRNCEICQKKRARNEFDRYVWAMLNKQRKERDYNNNWRFILLTGYHIPFDEKFRERIKAFSDYAQRFLEREYPGGGILTIELKMQSRKVLIGYGFNERGESDESIPIYDDVDRIFFLHAHAICWGGRKDKEGFDQRWGDTLVRMANFEKDDIVPVESIRKWAGRFTGLSTCRHLKAGLRYALKYIAKGVDVSNEEIEALRKLRLIRSWGSLYGLKKPEYEMRCKDCGAKCEVTFVWDTDELQGITNDLRIVLVPKAPP